MRRIMRAFSLWMMTGMALAGLHVQAQQCTIRQLPHAESFADTTRATCWHVLDADGVAENNWARVTDGGHGDNFSMKSLQGMPSDDWLVSPAIVVPLEGGNNLRLQWWVSAEAFYDIMPATYEVRVSTTDDTSTAMFSDSLFSETYAGEWVQRSLSLGGYAGQTIYVAFRNVSFLATSLSIDDVNLSIANDPVFEIDGPTLTILPDSAFFTARRVEGDTVGISYVWSSRMASARRANMNTRGSLLEMQYLQVGTDTITLTVQNQYGRSSVQHYVRVIECPTIATVPHFEGFEESVECWRVVSGNGTDADNWRQYFDTTMAHEGSGAMLSVYMGTQMPTEDMDEWLISPAFAIPQEVNGLVCSYYVLGASFMGSASQYEVRLSNGSARPEDFTTVLLTDSLATGYVQRNISLSEYAGRTVRFAFRNMTPLDGYLLAIDNFELRYALEPIYSLSGVSTIEVGADAGITANRIEGDTANLSFTWSSTMAAAGMATLTPQRDTLRVVYSQAGLDTITCVIRNGHGTTTLTHTLRAFSCEARTSIPYTESFEGDLDCWKIFSANTASDDDWEVYTDRQFAHSGRKMLLSYFSSDSVAADEWIVSPTFTLPDSAYGLVLSFYARGRNANGVNTAYEVRMSESTGLQPSDFDTLLLADEPSNTYVQHRINLEPYAGRTVRFAFRNVTPASTGAYLLIDDVAIRYANEPVYTLAGTTNIREGDTASFAATRVEGNTVGLQFAWSSTMAAAGNAQWVETADSSSSIIYSAAGNDTITLIVSNGYGSDTLTHSVRVYSCQPRAVYPYVEGFESQLDCWTFVNANERNVDGWSVYQRYARSGNRCLLGRYNDSADVDAWAITPALALPEGDTNINFSWYVRGTMYDSIETHYQVLIAASADADTPDFVVLHDETFHDSIYNHRSVSLVDYAGQTVKLAFRNLTAAGGSVMVVDDLTLSTSTGSADPDPMGVEETEELLPFTISPNPARGLTTITCEAAHNGTIEIIDSWGRTLQRHAMSSTTLTINTDVLAQGVYFVRMQQDGVVATRKLIVR